MKKLNSILFSLISPAICGDGECGARCAELDEKTLAAVFALAKKHDLGHLLVDAVSQNSECQIENDALVAELEKVKLTAVWRVRNTVNEQGRVRKCLEDAGVPFILQKGAVLRELYPEAWMRTSSDIDVLVPREMLSLAVDAFKGADGFKLSDTAPGSAAAYAASGVRIEIHTLLEGDKEDCSLTDSVWRDSRCDGGCERFMSAEHFYFYHVAHMAEHMRHGGCGIRPFIDLYLLNAKLGYEREMVEQLLREYGLDRFEKAADELSRAWMLGTDAPEHNTLCEYVLTGGVYGSIEQGIAVSRRAGRSKIGYVFYRIFMPYDELKRRHKALDGRPWLTPVFWVWRWLGLLAPSRLKRTSDEIKSAARVDTDRVKTVCELFDSLGL